jgi:NAD(P)-dependent dehydrogenase (short-subunit alcohol dehydrogenase family)
LQTCAETLDGLASSLLDILSVAGDISSPDFVSDLFAQVRERYGRLDYAVNCAGIVGNNLPSDQSSVQDFDKVTGVNYRGLWMCEKEELAIMKQQDHLGSTGSGAEGLKGIRRQRGSIVNVASQLAIVGRSNARTSHYQLVA